MKLTNNQLILLAVGVIILLSLFLWPCGKSDKSNFVLDLDANLVRGGTQPAPVLQGPNAELPDRVNGYGTTYKILGGERVACSSDPNHIHMTSCEIDDFSTWQDGTKRDFKHNPIYGPGEPGECDLRCHDPEQHPYNYQESVEGACY